MATTFPSYGLWGLVLINSAVFILFALSFFKPRTSRDWRAFGAFSAFLVALFAEMYGFPLTIYLLSGWLQSRYPEVDWLSHDAGHLLEELFGWRSNPHFGPFHLLSFVLIGVGFTLVSAGWKVLYEAQQKRALATTGVYAHVRHPQYLGFILVMLGFLLQWPTLLTLAMFPVLVVMYVRLARQEERQALLEFGPAYERYMREVPGFLPRLRLGRSAAILAVLWIASITTADADDGNARVVDGITVYLGVIPAEIVLGHPAGHPEEAMHGGAPTGRHRYHVVIALFEEPSGNRISEAIVEARVSGEGHVGATTVPLEPMTIEGTITFGNYVILAGRDRYTIEVRVRRAGSPDAAATFFYRHGLE